MIDRHTLTNHPKTQATYMLGLDQLLAIAISFLSKSKAVEEVTDAAEAAIRGKVSETYNNLKDKLIARLGGTTNVETTIESLESEPDSTEYQEQLTMELDQPNDPPATDPEIARLSDMLTEYLKQTPVAEQLTIRINAQGDKNIIIAKGNFTAGDINFGS